MAEVEVKELQDQGVEQAAHAAVDFKQNVC